MNNLMEYALNRNPNQSTPASWGTTALQGGNLTLTYTRRKAALNEMSFAPLWSASPKGPWSNTGVTEQILTDDGTIQSVRAQVALGGATTKYFKVTVNHSTGPAWKTFMTTHTAGTIWSDGQDYATNRPNMPNNVLPPAHLTVVDNTHMRRIIDFWAAQGGTHVSFPINWDATETSPGVFEWRPVDWILNYAASKGIKCNIYIWPVLSDNPAGEGYASTTSWKYTTEDVTKDHFGVRHAAQFMNFHSPKMPNYHRWMHGLAAHLAPFWNNNQIGYVAVVNADTKEMQYCGGDNFTQDGFHSDELAAYNLWHQARYGTVPGYPGQYAGSGNGGERFYKFKTETMVNFMKTSNAILKQYAPFRCVWDAGSFTDALSTRNTWAVLAMDSLCDGYKHNPEMYAEAAFDTRAAMAPTGWASMEWTNAEHTISDPTWRKNQMLSNIRTSIDAGTSDVSFAFFDQLANPSMQAYLASFVSDLKASGHWTKTVLPINTLSPDIVISTTKALNGGFQTPYVTPFNTVRTNGGGFSNIRYSYDLQ